MVKASNAGKRWPGERIRSILEALLGLDRADDLSFVLGRLSA
jgi:hypothetical protein